MSPTHLHVVDSHTGGEPTRTVTSGFPDLGPGPLSQKLAVFRDKFDHLRSAMANEPRGSDVVVGALLCEPHEPNCAAGVIFFNNVGYLGMCGHGTIGLVVTLGHLGKLAAGTHRLDTCVGVVEADYDGANRVTLRNVPSRRTAAKVTVEVPGIGPVTGDVSWGGNWFFLVTSPTQAIAMERVEELTNFTWAVRQALAKAGIRGEDGGEIDHVEVFGPPKNPAHHSRNFVLCPGRAYDRSPCGTGTSAKLACLAADGKLAPGQKWIQESVCGSFFEGSYQPGPGGSIIPTITGTAHITAETKLILNPDDHFRFGLTM